MTWARLDDVFPFHPKIAGLSDRAFRAHVTAICYCAQHKTGGGFNPALAKSFGAGQRHIGELITAGVWKAEARGYVIHDFLVYNPTREELDKLSEARSKAGKAGANMRWGRNSRRDGKTDSKDVATEWPLPLPSPAPAGEAPDPGPGVPPLPPANRGGSTRAARAKSGSNRKRDQQALRETQSLDERYLGRHAR